MKIEPDSNKKIKAEGRPQQSQKRYPFSGRGPGSNPGCGRKTKPQ